jgi:HK97 family phage prohead protease
MVASYTRTLVTKQGRATLTRKAGEPEGTLQAVFSTFDVVDKDRDVVVAGALEDGQPAPLVWSHDWTRPVGKGVVRTTPRQAEFHGRFFVETAAGLDAYRTVKAMGDLQEYSWGFEVLAAEPGTLGGEPVRFIKRARLFEVSPVLIGAGVGTGTLSLKGGRRRAVPLHDLTIEYVLERSRRTLALSRNLLLRTRGDR